ncbi:MAG: leucine-rich repeat protein [Clostridiales bacterium]|nr:leucine-rich repeat protein [Clostridiales bacterium]
MKRPRLLYIIIVAVVALIGAISIACGNSNPKKVKEGPETGIYYYDAEDGEYLITLKSGDVVTLITTETDKTGKYTVSGNNLTFKFTDEQYTAVLNNDILIVSMGEDEAELRFTKKITYTVTFDVGAGASAVESVKVVNGKKLARPATPTNGAMEFIGWYKDKEYTTPFIFESDTITGNTTLYARWVQPVFGQSEFTVDFDLNYETDETVESKKTIGGKLYDLPVPPRDGYSFRNWWVMCDGEYSYRVTEDTVFAENTTVYAMWQSTETSSKLATPIVDVTSNGISWGSNANARTFRVTVKGPDGETLINEDRGSTTMDLPFSEWAAGQYTISVTAISASGNTANNSDPAIRKYNNKALARVSLFTVVEPSTLIYNAVEGAEKYIISVNCGDSNHVHSAFDNGLLTSFNFVNCKMQDGGIKFTITATAEGKAKSVSEPYVYKRTLESVVGLHFDAATEEVVWNSVANAAGYTVLLSCENDAHDHNVRIDVGNKTSVSIKEYESCDGDITVKVTPYTKGYISPVPAELTVQKTTLAAPSNIRIVGSMLTWDGDNNATSYAIYVGGSTYTSATTSFDLQQADSTTWVTGTDYQIRVMSVGSGVYTSSLWSDVVDARYYAMYSSLTYNGGVVSWRRVIGVVSYNVKVNNGEAVSITDGSNNANVRLTQEGVNTISVNFVDKDGTVSDWATITVVAHAIEFDLRGAIGDVPTQYYAVGDKLYLPVKTDMEKTGYVFSGWYTTPTGPDGMGALYDDEYFIGTGGFVLYAYWKPEIYEITFDYNGGLLGVATGNVIYRQEYTWPIAEPADTSSVFIGWFSDRYGFEIQYTDENGNSLSRWNITRGMTVYACWASIFSFEKLSNGTYRISKDSTYFAGHAPDELTIPATYQGINDSRPISVTEIGSTSFTNSSMLKKVRIPNTIKYVDTNAFSGSNNIEAFEIYDAGSSAPTYSAIDGVLYHDALNDFGVITSKELLIYPRAKIGDFVMPSGVTLLPLRSLYYVKANKITIPATVTTIERNAFYYCDVSEIEFEFAGNVEEGGTVQPLIIYEEAFYYCSKLKKIVIPARLSSFNPLVFKNCNAFEAIEVEPASKNYSSVDGYLCNAAGDTILYCPTNAVVGELKLPARINKIGERAFAANTKITSVVFPANLIEIYDYAFSKCTQLESVTFDKALIGMKAKIGDYAFEGCTKLATVDFSESAVVKIGHYAFTGCTAIASITFPSSLTEIGQYAFNGCTKLETVEFEESEGSLLIDDAAFNGCTKITEITIPKHVTHIGEGVFAGCTKLATILVDEENMHYETWEGVLFSKGFEEMLFYPLGKTDSFTLPSQVKTLGARLFKNNTSISGITIHSNVTSIGDEAFMGCTGLKEVIIEDGDRELTIGAGAFEGCTNLTKITMANRIKVISDRMFYNNSKLAEFDMPDYVTSIGENAFYNTVINEITIPATVYELGYRAFYNAKKLVTVTFENAPEVEGDGEEEDESIVYADTLEVKENANYLAETFSSCSALTTVTLPTRLTSIGNSMFVSCTSLKSIYINNTVTYIGSKAFSGCTALTTVEFQEGGSKTLELAAAVPNTTPTTATGIFSGCTLLSSINLPNRIEYIPAYMFYNCRSLASITIPNSVKSTLNSDGTVIINALEKGAFQSCTGLVTVSFAKGNENAVTIGGSVFSGCSKLTTLNLPKGLTYAVIKAKGENDADIYVHDYYNIFGTDALLSCSLFNTITVEEGGKYYAVDGILYYKKTETVNDSEDDTVEGAVAAVDDGDGSDVTGEGATTKVLVNEAVYCPIGRTKAVVIPYDVTSINARAFFKAWNITSFAFQETPEDKEEVDLVINDGTDEITTGAFNQFIGITSITLPRRLTYIGDYAFYNCSMLQILTFPEDSRVKRIGNYAFSKCTNIRSVVIPAATETIGDYAFAGNVRTSSFTFAEDSQLKSIGSGAFSENVFTSIVIPNSVTTLGSGLFSGSSVRSVVLPSSLADIDTGIFAGCDTLTDISITGNSKIYIEDSVVYNAEKTALLYYPTNKPDKSYTVRTGTYAIYEGAFANNKYLEEITIPNTVDLIGEGAFYGSMKLTTVNFEADNDTTKNMSLNVGSSGDAMGAFQNCEVLQNVNLPQRTVGLGQYAFSGCVSLSNLTIHKNAPIQQINANVFNNAGSGTLALPDAVETIASNAFTGSLFSEITFGRGLKTIAANAFDGSGITKVVLPSSLESIGASAFANCENLESAEIKLNSTKNLTITTNTSTLVTSYGKYGTFYNCPNLRTATIASNGTLPYYMFYLCPSLATLTITGDATISGYLCYQLDGLKKVEIAKTVKQIGQYAFYECHNLGKHISETCPDEECAGASAHGFVFTGSGDSKLTTLGNYAFQSTAISSFVIPSSVTSVGTYLFKNNTALTSVTIPTKSFASINTQMFYGCTSLSNVTFDNSGTGDRKLVTVGSASFYGCTNLKSIDLTGFTTINNSTSTTNSAFYNAGLTSVTIPDSMTSLGAYAFYGSALTTITIPTDNDGLTTTGSYTFTNCTSLQTVTFTGKGTKLTTIGDYSFQGCTSLKSIVFPTGLTTIGSNSFANSGLTTVVLAGTVTSIDSQAFKGCAIKEFRINGASGAYVMSDDGKALLNASREILIRYTGSESSYTIPAGIKTIDAYAFYGCTTLEEITFNEDLETIGTYAFAYTTALTDVELPDSLTLIDTYAFAYSGITGITFGSELKTISNYAFNYCENLEEITFNDKLETIGSYAFAYTTALTDVELPDSLTQLNTYAFEYSGLTDVKFGTGLEVISNYAFYHCESLLSVNIPGSVKSIGATTSLTTASYAFAYCYSLQTVTLNSGLEWIGGVAFMECTSLNSIFIPASVKTIGRAAFAGCSALNSVTLEASENKLDIVYGTAATSTSRGAFADCTSLTEIDLSHRPLDCYNTSTYYDRLCDYLFSGCTNLETVTLPDNITSIGTGAFQNCLYLEEAPMTDIITTINNYAFYGSGINKAELPDTLKTIGSYAFMDCKLLEKIIIPGSVITINSAAFAGCSLLESVIFESDNGGAGLGIASGSGSTSFNPSLALTNRGVFGDCVSLKTVDLSTRSVIYNSPTNTTSTYEKRLSNFIFADCTSLTSVDLPTNTMLIGTGSFYNSGLTSFTINSAMTGLSNSAFAECSDLETVVVKPATLIAVAGGSSTTSISSLGVFYNCTALKSVDFSTRNTYYLGATTTSGTNYQVGGYLFYGCKNLESVKFPSNISQILAYAFYGCTSLAEIDIPDSVTIIKENAFRGSGLVNLKLPASLDWVYESAFRDCKALVSVQFPNPCSIRYITKYVFMDCTSLKSLYIPAGIGQIGDATFAGCTALETIEFEESATRLLIATGTGTEGEQRGMFADCTSLKTVDLSSINYTRFWYTKYQGAGATLSWSYTINSAVPEYMFYNCTNLESVKLGNIMWFGGGFSNNLTYADFCFGNCTSLKEVEFPTEVDFRLGDTSFYNCGFEELTIPSNMAGIGTGPFADNKQLTKLVVEPNTLCTYIRGFSGCEKLAEVELPYTLKGVDLSAFKDCVSLKTITLPVELDYIDSNAFQGSGLTSITIPSGVRMYSYAFADCKDLSSVEFVGTIGNFGWHLFENCTALTEITLPNDITYIPQYAFYGCSALTTLVIPATVTEIGDFAFADCTSLTEIIIPEAVEEMGDYVFQGWTSAQTIYIETHQIAPLGWSEYWNYNSKQVEITPELPPEDGDDQEDVEPEYEIQPDGVCGARIEWGYTRPNPDTQITA